jgi:hypothetical protein
MKNISRSFIFPICILFTVFAQAQNLKRLEDNNGFKKYKLGSRYTSVYGMKNRAADGSDIVSIPYMGDKIGDIPVQNIQLYYLGDTLAKIIVNFSPEYSSKLVEACKGSFGSVMQDQSDNEASRKLKNTEVKTGKVFIDRYAWKGKKINLEYYYLYPVFAGDAYSNKDLHLAFSTSDYAARMERSKKGKYTAKDF